MFAKIKVCNRDAFSIFLFSLQTVSLFSSKDIDIKKQGAVSAYAFVQYSDITSVVRALRKMDGEHIGANKIKVLSSLIICPLEDYDIPECHWCIKKKKIKKNQKKSRVGEIYFAVPFSSLKNHNSG